MTSESFANTPDADAGAELLARATACVPQLRERAQQTEDLGHVPDENIALLDEAGLFKILQPRRYGGHQQTVALFNRAMEELGTGCGATAWVAMIYNGLMWVASLFAEHAQEDLHRTPGVRIAGQFGPSGTMRRAEGGYLVDGVFAFASGCRHAHWLLGGSPLAGAGGDMEDHLLFLVPAREAQIRDDWNTSSMMGTGSNSYVLERAFIPAHRTLSAPRAVLGEYACAHLAHENLYRSAFSSMAAWLLIGPMIGMAAGALAAFRERITGKRIAYTYYTDQSQAAVTHLQVGEAAAKLEAARALSRAAAGEIHDWAQRSEYMDFHTRARLRATAGLAAKLCREAVDLVYAAGGGGVIHRSNPVQRFARDLHGATNHGMITPMTTFEMYGRVLFGLPQNTPVI
jgi:alkylation response protein AidB-like acyl-CoA dehydrogenase